MFYGRVCDQLPHHILCMIFQEKYYLCYILLTDQVTLCGCLCFLKYWAMCVLHLFVSQSVTSLILKLTFACLSSRFPKKSEQKVKYLKNEKNFYHKTKIIFHYFKNKFSFEPVTLSDIVKEIKDIKDSITPKMLKISSEATANILQKLLNESSETSTFPIIS